MVETSQVEFESSLTPAYIKMEHCKEGRSKMSARSSSRSRIQLAFHNNLVLAIGYLKNKLQALVK